MLKRYKKEHGTPFDFGQYNTVLTAVVKTLPGALLGVDPKELIKALERDSEIFKGIFHGVLADFASTFFFPLSDEEAEDLLCEIYLKKGFPFGVASQKAKEVVANWRKLATELGYAGQIAWKVREGFTLKKHAPKAGPCYENFVYLQDWNLENDEPTKEGLAFFIPRFLVGLKKKNVEEQFALLAETRQRFGLPDHHLSSFGHAAMLSGLILAHLKCTGERVPLNNKEARTDTFHSGGCRLDLFFDEGGLCCGSWYWLDDGNRNSDVGCFPLGVELRK